jgi:hypothetical protein
MAMISTLKTCRVCRQELTPETWTPSRMKRSDYLCKSCLEKQIRSIKKTVLKEEKDEYKILQTSKEVPKIELKEVSEDHVPTNELLKQMVEDTEGYRIEKVIAFIHGGYEDKVRKKALDYLLKVWEKLTPTQCETVVNQANRMLNANGVDPEIKIGVAIALKQFVGVKDSKKAETRSAEQIIRESEGMVEIDDDIL